MKTITRNGHTFTFDEDLALRWIEALESGKYQQGHGKLRHDDTFCCLGVACSVIAPTAWRRTSSEIWAFRGETAFLPLEYAARLGLSASGLRDDRSDWRTLRGTNLQLTGLNDTNGVSFLDIAAALRDYYEFPARESAVTS